MSQSLSLPSATALGAHTRAYTKQLAELEPPPSLPTRHPEIIPSFLHLLHPSTQPPSGRKHVRPQYIGSDISSDDEENDEDFAFSAVDQPHSDFQIPSITISSAHRPHHFLRRRRERATDAGLQTLACRRCTDAGLSVHVIYKPKQV